jgi:hypothetical protein
MNDSISSLVGVDSDAPEAPEKVEEAPKEPTEAPLVNGNSGIQTPVPATETAKDTTPVAVVVSEPSPTVQVDAVMEALNKLMGAGIGTTSSCKVLIYSDPGQGKSSIAGTVPNSLIFDFEDGLIAAAESPYGIAPGIRPMPYVNWKQAEAIVDKLGEHHPSLDWVETFTIDTYSDFSKRTLHDILKRDNLNAPSVFKRYEPKTEQRVENNEMHDDYARKLRDLDRDILILTHAKTVEPKNKPSKTYPDFSESFANRLEAKMDVVGYLKMEDIEGVPTPVMYTKTTGDDLVHCKRRIDIPDVMVSPTWADIKAGWERTQTKIKAMTNA